MQKPHNYLEIYQKSYPKIQVCSQSIKENIRELLANRGVGRIDQLTGRAKSVERFGLKAQKRANDGSYKYKEPLIEIQDQIGVRIITFYLNDVDVIAKIIHDNYEPIEVLDKHPDSYDAFSYEGKHFILFIPDEVKNCEEEGYMPSFFELQIKTMFQHAWAESEHDLNYKTENELSIDDKRLIALTAAQAWGADNVFKQLTEKYLFNKK
jgi:ppGpp synthetase/RelA/SpoT-type nucleotidyltranferase